MEDDALPANTVNTPTTAGFSSWGAKSERQLPSNTEVDRAHTPRDDNAAWRMPPACSPRLPSAFSPCPSLDTSLAEQKLGTFHGGSDAGAVKTAELLSSNIHFLLQQVEALHNQELSKVRSDLESQLELLRQGAHSYPQEELPEGNAQLVQADYAACDDYVSEIAPSSPSFFHSRDEELKKNHSFHGLVNESEMTPQYIKDHLATGSNRRKSVLHRNISKLVTQSREEAPIRQTHNKLVKLANVAVGSQAFDAVCAFAITLNATLLGISTDIAARRAKPDDLPELFTYMDRVFTCWFLLELVLRICADGIFKFFLGSNWSWNCFDFLVVITDLVETAAAVVSGGGSSGLQNLTAIRMLRVMRIVRAIRVIRLVRFFKELRMMVFSILRSGLSLLWSMILLTIIIFIFSVYLTQSVTFYLHYEVDASNQVDERYIEKLETYFGSLIYAGYMLFQCISGGVSWGEVGRPLLEIHWGHVLVLCFYVFFAIFAVLNIITGIFVDTAMNSAQADRDEVIHEAIHSEKSTLREMQLFFHKADKDKSGTITLQELEDQFQNQRVRAHFRTLGIEVNDARSIFYLLDLDTSGEISIEEFLFGCLKMKGNARSIDLMTLMHEERRLKYEMLIFFEFVRERLQQQQSFQEKFESFLQPRPCNATPKSRAADPQKS